MAEAIQTTRPVARQTRRGFPINLHEGWIAGILLALMLISATASVANANWVDGLWLTMYAAIGGLLFGALLSRLRMNSFAGFVLAVIVGAAFVSWLTSSMVGAPPDASWNEKMLLIQERLDVWLVRVIAGGIGTDNYVFLFVMCAMAWLLGYISAWFVFRHHQPWGAILPIGAALIVNLFYAPPQSGLYMMLFLLATLLLLVRTTLLKRQETWSTYAVRFANDIGLDFLTYGVIFSGLVILLAWLIPPTAPGPAWLGFIYESVREPWQDMQDDVSRAFSNVRGTDSAAPTTFFSSSLTMGGPIRLGDREVFKIDSPYGRYWRAVMFDTYSGVGWVSSAQESADFIVADPRMKTMPMDKRKEITQTVEVRLPTDNLVISASQPMRVNAPVNAKYTVGRSPSGDVYLDLQQIRLQQRVALGDQYIAISSISAADIDSLRRASTNIPASIRAKYLDLPDSVTDRTRELAASLTANETNNYDKARAIEQYLRQNITYNDSVDPVPAGWDGVDYLLFERPEGYCNYYASAMAVMARSVGIPARVASGYGVGSASDDGYYHVSEANAHSWPEIYLGELGWVEFEPTSSQPEISRPIPETEESQQNQLEERNQNEDTRTQGLGDERIEDLENQDSNERPGLAQEFFSGPLAALAMAILFLGLVAAGAFTVIQLRWRRYLATLKPGARAAAEMYRFAPFAGFVEHPEATADERAGQLIEMMPDVQKPIGNVNRAYIEERYGGLDLTDEEATAARSMGIAVQKRTWRSVYEHHVGSRIAAVRDYVQDAKKGVENLKPKQ